MSPDTDFCPHCGYDLRKRRSSFWPAAIIALVALLIGAGIALAVAGTGNDKTKTVTKNVVTGAPTSKTNVTVTAPERTISVPGPTQTITVTVPTTPSTAP